MEQATAATRPANPLKTLHVDNVSISFGGIKAITDVSLNITSTKVLGLIGPNGAGKTTLVNCISGFLRPTHGSITIEGQSTQNWTPAQARRRGVTRTFQGGRLFGSMSVLQNVEVAALSLGMRAHQARQCAQELLDWVGYSDSPDRLAESVAYVDERRIGIARALVGQPDYVLLDEPAAGMSDTESEQLAGIIRELPAQLNCGVLLIEHNMRLISNVCDYVHVLNSGCTLAHGTPADVLSNKAVIAAYLGEEA